MSRSLIFPSAPTNWYHKEDSLFQYRTATMAMYYKCMCVFMQCLCYFCQIAAPTEYIDKLQYNSQIRNSMKILPMWIALFCADRRTDVQIWRGRNPDGGVTVKSEASEGIAASVLHLQRTESKLILKWLSCKMCFGCINRLQGVWPVRTAGKEDPNQCSVNFEPSS